MFISCIFHVDMIHSIYSNINMIKTFVFRLYPTKAQAQSLSETIETVRRWYNECLAERKTAYETEKRSVSKFAQLAKVKDYKANNPYAAGIHSHILQVATSDLDKAFQAFFRRVKSGETPGYPRFKSKDRFDSIGLKEYGNGFKIVDKRLKVSGVGNVKVRWHREIEGDIKTVRIKHKAGKWFASFACEVEANPLPKTGKAIGVDVGLSKLLTLSNGETVDNPRNYRKAQARLRVLQRSVARKKKGGANRRKAIRLLQAHHLHVANQRSDFAKKVVFNLVSRFDVIAIEDLQVSNMAHHPTLAKSILDAGWAYFRSHLSFKAEEAGKIVVAVDPAYTSKTCSECGQRIENLTLAVRWINCDCGASLDRDHNAAINILKRAGHARLGSTWDVSPCVLKEAPMPLG